MQFDVCGERALAHVRHLTQEIGVRLAGGDGERRAAEYIAGELRRFGVDEVAIETFPCLRWGWDRLSLAVDGKETPCLPVAHTPATPEGGVEAEVVYLERGGARDLARQPLEGRIGLLSGCFPSDPAGFRALMHSGLAGLIVVDPRLPFEWPVAVGVAPHWIRMGMIPAVSVSYHAAWEMVRAGVRRARLEIGSWRQEGESTNVVGLLHGSEPAAGEVALTCHHDSVVGSVGGEDNGSGVGCVLELARAFAGSRPRRSLRFLACGTEEQLSEGARAYVLRHREEMDRVAFVLNTDSVGSWMGENEVYVAGQDAVRRLVEERLAATDFSARVMDEVSPFSDHFPFTATGVPGVWFHRSNCAGGRWFHHSTFDTEDVLSPAVMGATLRTQAHLLNAVANAPAEALPRGAVDAQREQIDRMAQDLYGVQSGFRE